MEVTSLYKTAPIFFITLLLSCNNRITDETNKSLLENDSLVSDTISTINQHQVDTAIISLEQKEVTSIDYKYIYNAFFYEGQPYCLIGTINQFGKEQFKATNKGDKIYYSIPDPKIYYSVENEVKFNNDSYQPSISKGFLLFDSLFYDNNHYIKLYFNPVNKIRTTQAILTDKPLPEQDWVIIKSSERDKQLLSKYYSGNWERIDKIKTRQGIFILAQYNKGIESEFDVHQTFFFELKNNELIKICDFEDQWNWPYMDIDGDGVPEILGNTDYKSPVIRKMYPKYEIIAKMDSGI